MPAAEWTSTGHGSFRVLRKGVCEAYWRPLGTKGPRKHRIVACTPKEMRDFLKQQSLARSRFSVGMATELTWPDAIALYEERLIAKDCVTIYRTDVLRLLAELRAACPELWLVEPLHIQTWLDRHAKRLKADGRKGWASTCNHFRNMVSGFFQFLHRVRKIPSNPVSATFQFEVTKRPKRQLEPAEYARLWKHCEPSIRDLLDFYLLTSCRFSEAAILREEQIKGNEWVCQDRKGKDYCRMHLSPQLLRIVARQPHQTDSLVFHKWVPRRPNSGKGHGFSAGEPIDKNWFREVIINRATAAGLEKVTPHDIRHAHARWARRAGVNPFFIQSALGHSTVETTEIYAPDEKSGTKVSQLAVSRMRQKALKSIGVS